MSIYIYFVKFSKYYVFDNDSTETPFETVLVQ